ncbi:MAG: hypothetical protein KME52_24365 [Desmonostoc geniculatum HA4340-LM1]|nr:hypothetical protein [Desmonostoc geniculatum HA4340-LM1]
MNSLITCGCYKYQKVFITLPRENSSGAWHEVKPKPKSLLAQGLPLFYRQQQDPRLL